MKGGREEGREEGREGGREGRREEGWVLPSFLPRKTERERCKTNKQRMVGRKGGRKNVYIYLPICLTN